MKNAWEWCVGWLSVYAEAVSHWINVKKCRWFGLHTPFLCDSFDYDCDEWCYCGKKIEKEPPHA